jgi:hypothetical protein
MSTLPVTPALRGIARGRARRVAGSDKVAIVCVVVIAIALAMAVLE